MENIEKKCQPETINEDNNDEKQYEPEIIEFTVNGFNYVIKFSKTCVPSIHITCTHVEEFYSWSFTTDKNIDNQIPTNTIENVAKQDIKIHPKMLFDMFCSFKNNSLEKMFELVFPKDFKTHETNLNIYIFTTIAYSKYVDHKYISLAQVEISEYDRFLLKSSKANKLFMEQTKKELNDMREINETLKNEINNTKNIFNESIKNLVENFECEYAKDKTIESIKTEEENFEDFEKLMKKFLANPKCMKYIIDAISNSNVFATKDEL
ncbi:hypothetical protein [Acanthamoeba polyphaga mimivirus]|uniref:Uncharacterized protein n=1 Tax=Acanthamoeba polyphaga mimivirus TaxID=212035 RepID=A0A0G2Y0B5_MIMIV|nr:hypothetical protein [Acanthamoeba polyphaga mimivirus]